MKRKPNRTPRAWKTQPPNTPYPCAGKAVGAVVPGKPGGTVTACATPSTERPDEGQYWFGLPTAGAGKPVRKSVVRQRLHKLRRPKISTPVEIVAQSAAYNEQEYALPTPTGVEVPHDPNNHPCSPGAPLWGKAYRDAVKGAMEAGVERAAIQSTSGDVDFDPSAFANPATDEEKAVYETFMSHPEAPKWEAQAQACSRDFRRRQAQAKSGPQTKAERLERKRMAKRAVKKAEKEQKRWERKVAKALKATKKQRKNPAQAPLVGYVQLSESEMDQWRDSAFRAEILRQAVELAQTHRGSVAIIDPQQTVLDRVVAYVACC